jgi:hypothetical protein
MQQAMAALAAPAVWQGRLAPFQGAQAGQRQKLCQQQQQEQESAHGRSDGVLLSSWIQMMSC